jgi:hypothetical protein
MKHIVLSVFLSISLLLTAQEDSLKLENDLLESRIPQWVKPIMNEAEWTHKFQISDSLNPFYLEGDFNGDKYSDIAFHVVNSENGKTGILIVHRNVNKIYLVGAGQDFGMGDHMNWVKVWGLHHEKVIDSYLNGRRKRLAIKYPAIRIQKDKKIAAYFYWTGSKYRTFNQVI